MTKWKAAPDSLVRVFEKAIATIPGATPRKVFGYPAVFYHRQMFAGLHRESLILRLPEIDRASFLEQERAKIFEPMPGRPMREYVLVPTKIVNSPKELLGWLGKAFRYAVTLPPKKPSSSSRKKKKELVSDRGIVRNFEEVEV